MSGGQLAMASSRENFSFFTVKRVEPNDERFASEKVGYSINWSNESTGESSQVPFFVSS